MHAKNKVGTLALLLLLCLVAAVVLAGGIVPARGGVSIDSWLIGGGGSTRNTAGNVSLGGALGQAIAGRSTNGSIDLQSGFWTGPRSRSTQFQGLYLPLILAED